MGTRSWVPDIDGGEQQNQLLISWRLVQSKNKKGQFSWVIPDPQLSL